MSSLYQRNLLLRMLETIYRPISIIDEKILAVKLNNFLESNSVFPPQFHIVDA